VYSRASLTRSGLALLSAWRMRVSRVRGSSQDASIEYEPDEQRLRQYLERPGGVSESVCSLADKLEVSQRQCRRVLERMVEQGTLKRQDFADMEPIYSRFPTRSTMAS
jgi:hypothetical protein